MRAGIVLFLLLIISACNANTTPERIDDPPTPVIVRMDDTATPVDSVETAVTPVALSPRVPRCDGAPMTRLIIQERGRVTKIDEDDTESLNLRAGPSTSYTTLRQIPPGDTFYVLDGPTCEGGYAWYRVIYQGIDGWVAEGDDTGYFVEPYLPG